MAEQVLDALIDVDSSGSTSDSEYASWVQMLEKPKNRKGLTRLELRRFHGQAGMKTFKALGCSQADGTSVEKKGDVADLDSERVAHAMYTAAIADGRERGLDCYQLVCVHCDGKDKEREGEKRGLRFNVVTGQTVWSGDTGPTPAEEWERIASFYREALREQVGQHGQVMSSVTSTLITAVQMGDELAHRRIEHARAFEAAALPASPEAVNERWAMGLNALGNTMREVVRFAVWNKTGIDPGPIKPGAAGPDVRANTDDDDAKLQGELRDYFAGLDGETHEKLRAKMGQANFDGLIAILHGDLGNFKRNFPMLGAMLGTAINGNQLAGILTDAQLRELCQIFGVEPPTAGNAA